MADDIFSREKRDANGNEQEISNIESTKQALYRSIFISAMSCFEQNLDEICVMRAEKSGSKWRPSDLKDRGVNRSIKYAQKELGKDINKSKGPWPTIFLLIELRNHLVHYGANLSDNAEHLKIYKSLSNGEYVSFEAVILFNREQLENSFSLLLKGVKNFIGKG